MKDTTTKGGRESATATEHASAVEQVLKALTKLVNGRKIYAENNPRLEQFRKELDNSLRKVFEVEDELVLTIDQYAMRWNDAVVYENTAREDSLAYILFRDGIGELTIRPKAVGKETAALVDILASEIHNRDVDEDVVTRLWTSDFQHISYRVLDDYMAGEYGAGAASGADEHRHDETSDHPELLPEQTDPMRPIAQRTDVLQSIDAFLRRTLASHHPEGDDGQREALYQRLLRTNFAVAAEEIAIYTRELEAEKAEDGIAAFVETIIAFTLLPDNPTAVRDVMAIVERLVDYIVDEKHPATLAWLTQHVQEFEKQDDLPAAVREFAAKLLSRLTSPAVLSSLFERIDRPGPFTDATLRYAAAIGAGAVESLTRVLHRIEGHAVHRQICDTLIAVTGETGAQGMTAALERFDIDNPAVALDAVYIARSMQLPLSQRLRELAFYPEPRVKLEMIDWISEREDEESSGLLLALLADLDKRIRLRALDALTGRNTPRVREKVSELAFGKDFNERAADEQEAFFRTLGSVGDLHTVEQIRAMIERRRRIGGSGKGSDVKLLAIRALERIKHPAALELVSRLGEDGSEAVRLRAARARETLSAALSAQKAEKAETEPAP